ncbi:hypothetical protein, partial [Staphylococcus aureus]|uniref:hypothetical protein n=1 Tax=Staphylococcus aureus TaxID=1280 RepID=UPI00132FD097
AMPIAEPMMAIGGLIILISLALGFPIAFLNRQEKNTKIYTAQLVFFSIFGVYMIYSNVTTPFRWMHLPLVALGF